MYWKKWAALLSLFLLLVTAKTAAAENSGINLYFGGVRVDEPEIKVIEKNGHKFINLPFLLKYLHASVDWNPEKRNLYLKFGKYTINLFENSTGYVSNGRKRSLPAAPFEKDGELWIPVAFYLRLGLVVKSEDRHNLKMDWEADYLVGVENASYQGRPAFVLIGSKPFQYNSFLLVNPDRLVLDLTGLKLHWAFDGGINENDIVKKVRFSQSGEKTLRLVFDLYRLAGYKIIRDPERPNQLTVVFNYFVEKAVFFHKDNERKVYIKSTAPPNFQVTSVKEPRRLVIDFKGATLGGQTGPFNGDGEWIKTVRMSQFDPETVRVVLDLNGQAQCFVIPAPDDPNSVEVRSVQTVTKVNWVQEGDGGRLVIESDGQLLEKIEKLKNTHRFEVDLQYSRFDPQIKVPLIKSDQLKSLRLIEVGSELSRIELDFNYYYGYTSELSKDRRRLTIHFKKSPVTGKTIVLDAGHGGVDMGACGRQGTREKDVNIEVVMRLKDLLEEAGANVVLTRVDDSFISLYERPFLANHLFCNLFISIHTNNHTNYNVNGIEVYYHPGRTEAKHLAEKVQQHLVSKTKLKDRGARADDFCVTRETQMPSILIELGYLSNFQEESLLKTSEFRSKAAEAIFEGIMEYSNGK
ncbi:MAG: AMIN domain-containing protein [Firmicutes bacterium]|nr:AMIN domain-containing protein [Bacillota bacterium]